MFEFPRELNREIISYLEPINILIFFHSKLVKKILFYLPFHEQMLINKYYYNNCKNNINLKYNYKFFINIVKGDMITLFEKYVNNHNKNYWVGNKKYYYEKYVFKNLLQFLDFISIKYNALKCKRIIENLKENCLYKNKHKNKIYKNIIWT